MNSLAGKERSPPNSSPILTYSRKLSSNLTQPNMCRAYVELLPMVWVLHCEGPRRENDKGKRMGETVITDY